MENTTHLTPLMSEFYVEKPPHFSGKIEVSTVFIECEGKILLLKRVKNSLGGGLWAIPGGKLEKGEAPNEALLREIEEELKLFPTPKEIEYLSSYYVKHPLLEYRLHLFRLALLKVPEIVLCLNEHTDFMWETLDSINAVDLIEGQLQAFKFAYPSISDL